MGVEPEEALPFLREIVALNDSVELVGLSTHFATSDEIDSSFFR
jgi:alanine racemase